MKKVTIGESTITLPGLHSKESKARARNLNGGDGPPFQRSSRTQSRASGDPEVAPWGISTKVRIRREVGPSINKYKSHIIYALPIFILMVEEVYKINSLPQ